ncbi:MAG TPA: HAMP domain-containing sensor histidine kinase [Acidobacteriaceae bacterium]|nr:HAMP domain-containing sensor histidine kinase [Acidobacteriaceae bacterium]
MEIKVLWFESQEKPSDVAGTALLQHDGVEIGLVHVRTLPELRQALEEGAYSCAVVVQDSNSATWRDILGMLSSAADSRPVVLLMDADSEEQSREALLAGAWHAVPRHHRDLCAAALRRTLRHAAASQQCSETTQALKLAEAVLEKNQRSMALGLLLGSIAHEINNPLEGVANLLYLAKRARTDQETLQVCLDMSEAELSRVAEITKQMLSFQRNTVAPQDVSLAELLDGILALFTARLRERKITVRRQYDSAGWMLAYPGELRQAFVNLIANAIDAMPSGGQLTLRVRERGGASPHLCLSIADSGKGISREVMNHLGELFLTTKGESGTGIGLWVTRRILQKHDGGLRVYSSQRAGRSGSVFTLCFPPPHARFTGNKQRRIRRSGHGRRHDADGRATFGNVA